jgi:hypothetical protein
VLTLHWLYLTICEGRGSVALAFDGNRDHPINVGLDMEGYGAE